jgi:SAM-dependent methyltransferase
VRTGSLDQQAFLDGSFDGVVINHVLEHVFDLGPFLGEVARVLRPGGWLLIRVPNASSWEAAAYGPHWPPWELPRHLIHFSPASLAMVLRASRFSLVRQRTEFRATNIGLNAAYAAGRAWDLRFAPRLLALSLAIPALLAAWLGRGADLAVLARREAAGE